MAPTPTTILDRLRFPEGPRWRDGRLYFSDMHSCRVIAVDVEGNAETIAEVPTRPSGLGWTPDGRLLIVSMTDRRLLRQDPGGLTELADLSKIEPVKINDMLVDAQGRAYIGGFGFDRRAGDDPVPTALSLVYPSGEVKVAAEGLEFPNGTVLTPDGATLVVAESFGGRLSAFDVAADGTLSNRRVWADLSVIPDGICLDAEGAIWVACPTSSQVVRVREGGEITDSIAVETDCFACMLGGADRRTLFICTSPSSGIDETTSCEGRIEIVDVEVPGAGLP